MSRARVIYLVIVLVSSCYWINDHFVQKFVELKYVTHCDFSRQLSQRFVSEWVEVFNKEYFNLYFSSQSLNAYVSETMPKYLLKTIIPSAFLAGKNVACFNKYNSSKKYFPIHMVDYLSRSIF